MIGITARRRAAARPIIFAVGMVVLGASRAPARADVIYRLVPSVSAGVSDNPAGTSDPALRERDEFGTVSVGASALYERALSAHSLSLTFGYTRYLHELGPDALSNAISWTSAFRLTGVLELRLSANASIGRVSRVDATDPTTVVPQALMQGSTYMIAAGANESLAYRPSGKRTYTQALGAFQVRYFDTPNPLPTATSILAQARGTQLVGRDSVFVDVMLTDTFTPSDPTMQASPYTQGHVFLGQLFAGAQHVLSAAWSVQAQAGPVAVFKLPSPGVIAPGGILSFNYQRRPWFGGLTLSQAPAPNLYIGQTTINDQVLARLALPLDRRESVFITGYGSYIYARMATAQGGLARAFDQRTAGIALTARFTRLPMGASLQYSYVDQHGNETGGQTVPDLQSQSLTFNLSGYFSWGPGTPPLFGGGP